MTANAAVMPRPRPSVSTDDVIVEARLLEAARRCITASDPTCAKARLAEYQARFAQAGALAEEASLLSLEALVIDGNRGAARRLARSLLEKSPHGAWSTRVRKLAEEPDE